jgi:MIF4G domain
VLRTGRYQRQVGQARLLGEAYNYRLLPSRCVLDTLHLILAAGHANPEQAAALDPPASYFRIRCAVLSRAHAESWLPVLPLFEQGTRDHRARIPPSIRSKADI